MPRPPIKRHQKGVFAVCSSMARATGPSLCSIGFVIKGVYESAFASGFTCLDQDGGMPLIYFLGFIVGTHLNDGPPMLL